jgi:hypothetical protein
LYSFKGFQIGFRDTLKEIYLEKNKQTPVQYFGSNSKIYNIDNAFVIRIELLDEESEFVLNDERHSTLPPFWKDKLKFLLNNPEISIAKKNVWEINTKQ